MKPARPIRCLAPLLAAAALAFGACANVTHTMLYQDSNLGIKGGYNPETSNIAIHVGFRRNFATIVPKVNHDLTGTAEDLDAASVYNASTMVVRGLSVPDIDEITVTGDAAVALASSKGALLPFQKK